MEERWRWWPQRTKLWSRRRVGSERGVLPSASLLAATFSSIFTVRSSDPSFWSAAVSLVAKRRPNIHPASRAAPALASMGRISGGGIRSASALDHELDAMMVMIRSA